LHIFFCSEFSFYCPSPRAIDPAVTKALPIALVLTYIVPVLQTLLAFTGANEGTLPGTQMWMIAHACLPMLVAMLSRLYSKTSKILWITWQYGAIDLANILRFQSILFSISIARDRTLVAPLMSRRLDAVSWGGT
jgi:hypothetical protein